MSRELKFKKMKNLRLIVLVNTLLLMATFTSCKKEPVLPTLITSPVGNIEYVSATSGGYISDDGGAEITARGIVWNTSPYPTTANNSISDSIGSGTGNFTCNLTGLTPFATYYVRSYAINSAGTAYGDQQTFSAKIIIVSNPGAGVTYNGYTYSSVVLGNGQEWMAENLRTANYRNGDPIPTGLSNTQWEFYNTGAYAIYNNDNANDAIYGKLYNGYAVSDPRHVCPTGWHEPADAEWTELADYLGGDTVAGGKMKSTGLQYWSDPNTDATNESGFSGLPGGLRFVTSGAFGDEGNGGYWWSSSSFGFVHSLSYTGKYKGISSPDRQFGASVRCIKD
jgi:uncharacterized protein (TIGR02145 family)